ncbi:MAG: hypothetical protein WB689_23605, partial [Xanthobacteraceae bacterium]
GYTATDGRDPSIVKNKKSTRIATSQSSDPFRKKRFDTTKTQSGHGSPIPSIILGRYDACRMGGI